MNSNEENTVISADERGQQPVSAISQVLGIAPVLPGENEDLYTQGLSQLIAELEAKTVLQVYLAEKIFDCLWWLRRYEDQKRMIVLAEMTSRIAYITSKATVPSWDRLFSSLLLNSIDDKVLVALTKQGVSLVSIRLSVINEKRLELLQLDQQIALQTKILAGLQASFEVAFNRKLNSERLMLQNEILHRDLAAIDITPDDSPYEKPKTGRRKPA